MIMKLEEIRKLNISRSDLIELVLEDEKWSKLIRPGYYLGLIEKVPKLWKGYHVEPPFIEVAYFLDKNGSPKDIHEYNIKKVLDLAVYKEK